MIDSLRRIEEALEAADCLLTSCSITGEGPEKPGERIITLQNIRKSLTELRKLTTPRPLKELIAAGYDSCVIWDKFTGEYTFIAGKNSLDTHGNCLAIPILRPTEHSPSTPPE